jgi:hypothetical protein
MAFTSVWFTNELTARNNDSGFFILPVELPDVGSNHVSTYRSLLLVVLIFAG